MVELISAAELLSRRESYDPYNVMFFEAARLGCNSTERAFARSFTENMSNT